MRLSPLTQQQYTLEDLRVGQQATFDTVVETQDLDAFARLSGDRSDLHMNEEFARRSRFRGRVAHGLLPFTAVSTLVGMCLPGRQALLLGVSASFLAPARIGDVLRVTGTIASKSLSTRIVTLKVQITQQTTGQLITEGTAEVLVTRPPNRGVTMRELHHLNGDLDFTGKTVLVTGASRGIGEATAKLFAKKGANVAVNYRLGKEDAEAIVREITEDGHQAIAVQADITNPREVAALVERTLASFHRLDVLVNNAVRDAAPVDFGQLTWDAVQQDIDVIVKGTFQCCQAVLPIMLKQNGGAIVNVSTLYTEAPVPRLAGYITAKSGLVGLTRALAAEYAGRNIQINLVSPSLTPTDLTASLSDQALKRLAEQNPMKRLCQPLDIAKAIVVLASPYAQFTTGQQLMVTGGSPPFL